MYCKNCNAYNDDGSRFCCQCGTELEAPVASQQSEQTYTAPQNDANAGYADQYSSAQQSYTAPQYGEPQYSQPNYSAPQGEPTAAISNTMAIVSIVLNIVVFNVVGLIFAILSLTNYNSYEGALRAGNIALAEQFKAKSKKYSKVAIILVIIMAVLAFIAGIAAFVGVFVIGSKAVEEGFVESYPYEYDFENFMMMLAPYFG